MSTDRSPNYLRGFLAPFRNFTAKNQWITESTLTQGEGRAGIPSADQNGTSLIVTAKGNQKKDVDIITHRSGHVLDNAGFLWKETSESVYYGLDVPTMIGDFSTVLSTGGAIALQYICRSAIRLKSGVIIIASEKIDATKNHIFITAISTKGTSSNVTIDSADVATLGSEKRFPALCELPDGSIICAFWVNSNVENLAQIKISRSIDQGKTWSLVSSRALPEDIDTSSTFGAGNPGFDLDKITISANSSQVLLFAGLLNHNESQQNGNVVKQYGSTSEGMKFQEVATTSATTGNKFYFPDIVQFNDTFIISWIKSEDSIAFTRLSNAFESITTKLGVYPEDVLTPDGAVATSVSFSGGNRLNGAHKSMWLDTDGRIYLAYCTSPNQTKISGAFSDLQGVSFNNYGKKWELWGQKTGSTEEPHMVLLQPPAGTGAGGIINITGCSGLGPQEIFFQFDPNGVNTYKHSIFRLSMGGYSTINYPSLMDYPQDQNRSYTTLDWIPIDLPSQNSVWTKNTSGSPTETLTSKLSLSCGNTETISYSFVPTDKSAGIILHSQCSNIVGTSSTRGNGVRVQIQEKTSTDTVYAEVIIKNDSIFLYDAHAGYLSPLASATGLSLTITDLILYVDNSSNKVSVYYSESGNPRRYAKLSGSLTTNSSTTQKIEWGIISSTGTARSADWHMISWSQGAAVGFGIDDSVLFPRNYPPQGFSVSIEQGLQISTLDGPARESETYTINTRYDTPIDRVLYPVAPNTSVVWRSDQIAGDPDANNVPEEIIAWALDSNLLGVQDSRPISDSVGIHLSNVNFRFFDVQKYSGGAWSTVGTYHNDIGGVFNFTRNGNSLISTAANGTFLHLDEAAGWRVLLDDGVSVTLLRKVKANSEGVLANTSSKRAVLQLEDVKNTDPTSGTAYLIPDSFTLLLHNIGTIAALRIRIKTQATKEGYFQIGQMVLGNLIIPASQYSRGRTIAFESDVTENISSNGVLRSQRTGKGGRIVRIAWTEGIDISALYESNANPDYYKAATGGLAIAAEGSAPTSMIGLVSMMTGSTDALVYLPSISHGASTSELINRYHDHVLCTMGNDVQIENIVGNESRATGTGEVMRVGTVIFRETR